MTIRLVSASLLALALGCVPSLPEGHYACAVADSDCPTGWSCSGGRCVSSEPIPAADAGVWPVDGASLHDAAVSLADAAVGPVTVDGGVILGDASMPPGPTMDVAVGSRHACMVTATGLVLCWGDNTTGGLGVATSTALSTVAVEVPGVPSSRAVCAGTGFSCALTSDAHVRCWGRNDLWQLGRAVASPASAGEVPGVRGATAITCGGTHACAATASGVFCWGANGSAQTGAPSSSREAPHVVAVDGAVRLAAGEAHTCALGADGAVRCWGAGAMGQLGPSAPGSGSAVPVSLPSMHAIAIAAGAQHTCVAQSDGTVACWGCADAARLGVIATGAHPSPEVVHGASDAALVAGGDELSCAASRTGAPLSCWGSLAFGQLGNGGTPRVGSEPTPSAVASMPGAVDALDAGSGFACALSEQRVFCWGLNDRGQLGDGSTSTRTAPVEVRTP